MAKVLSAYEKKLNDQKIPAGEKKVLIAALHLFAKQGFHATTTAEIAKEAHVSEGTIYKYFPSKRNLLSQLLTPLLSQIRNSSFTKLKRPQSLDQLISLVVHDRIQFAEENFELIKILLQECLTSINSLPSFDKLIQGHDGLYAHLQAIQKTYPEINQSLTPIQMIRAFVAPMITYIMQVKLFDQPSTNKELDLRMICNQISAGLTTR